MYRWLMVLMLLLFIFAYGSSVVLTVSIKSVKLNVDIFRSTFLTSILDKSKISLISALFLIAETRRYLKIEALNTIQLIVFVDE